MMLLRLAPWALVGALGLLLTGCATPARTDVSLGELQTLSRDQFGAALREFNSEQAGEAISRETARLLGQTLDVNSAVQIALLNNRSLQAGLAELGLSQAQRLQASRWSNPGISLSQSRQGTEISSEVGLHVNVAQWLMRPVLEDMANHQHAQARHALALQIVQLGADTRKAFHAAVGARETSHYMAQVMRAAQASAELARRMAQAGNFSRLQQAREQGFYAEAAQGLARAKRQEAATRERLIRLLGLWGEQAHGLQLPDRLAELPATPRDQPGIEQTAMTQRLDLQAARLHSEQVAKNLGLVKSNRFINVLELGLSQAASPDAPRERSWEIRWEIPLFDSGSARVAQAEAIYRQSLHRAAAAAVNARSEVREAYLNYRHAWDMARHQRDEILPLARRVSEENLLRYNGMLIGVFELLADARAQIASVHAAIEALRDFWIAQAELDMALVGKPSLTAAAGPAPAKAEPGGGGH